MSIEPTGDAVAVITGGSGGIGKAIAQMFALNFTDVVVNYRNSEEEANAIVAEINDSSQFALAVQADVSTAEGAARLVDTVVEEFGRIDILVNNAGITRDTLLMRMAESDWDDVLTTNLKSAFLCSKAAIRPMLKQRSGRIISITSVVGQAGNAGQANYAAAKAGIIGFTKSLAKEVGSRGITVNAIAPGFVDTRMTAGLPDETKAKVLEQTPLRRFGTPDDIAGAVVFLAGPHASFITGHTLTVDGGLFMP